MNIVKMNIHSSREGILTVNPPYFTCISDQKITDGDVIMHPQYSKVINGNVFTFVINKVEEERPSKGDWKGKEPSTFRKVSFKKETISGQIIKEAGLLKTELVKNDKGVMEEKNFLIF